MFETGSGSDPQHQGPFQILKTSPFYESQDKTKTHLMLWKPKGIKNYRIGYISDSPPPLKFGLSSASKIFLPGILILSECCY